MTLSPALASGTDVLRWDRGRSPFWQFVGVVGVWGYVIALHLRNDGLWYQGDSSRHAANGLFWWDFLARIPVHPLDFALSYYARYPVISPTAWPPVFYLIEGFMYKIFGISPFVAKGLVLAFALGAGLYSMAWLRRWVGPEAGWGATLILLQPGVVMWSHAVMLSVPSMALSIAALYHWRAWLERQRHTDLNFVAVFGVLAVLTYIPVAVLLLVALLWTVREKRIALLADRRVACSLAFAIAPLAVWAVVALRWAPSHRALAMYQGDYPAWRLQAWTFYLERISQLVSVPIAILVIGMVGFILFRTPRSLELRYSGLWLATAYVWFSVIAVKEPRHALFLIPPLVYLAVTTMALTVATLNVQKRSISLALIVLAVVHAGPASGLNVGKVEGFREVAGFIRQIAPGERVFYEGTYNGVFSYYVRAQDPRFEQSVVLGSKLLYATRIEARFGVVEGVASVSDVLERLRNDCGCRVVVVEREIAAPEANIKAVHLLREALTDRRFRLIRTFDVQSQGISHVDVYEQVGAVADTGSIQLRFPALQQDVIFRARPIER